MKIVSKAYELDLSRIEEGYLLDSIMCHADSLGKAKSILLNKVKYDNYKLCNSEQGLNYLSIPVKRMKCNDKIIYENKEIYRNQIDSVKYENERLLKINDLFNNNNIEYCYILKNGYFYRNNWCGYTSILSEAGIYQKSEAVLHAKQCKEIVLKPVDITYHNIIITYKIKELANKIIS